VSADPDSVDGLIAAGRHAEAAARALATGEPRRAADLYEKLWDFRSALGAARAAGDLPRALRYAIEVHDEPQAAEILGLLEGSDDGARAALDILGRMRRHAEAAPLAERLGDHNRAIDHYTRAHKPLEAARLLEAQGRDRDAGRLLERAMDLASEAERGPIQVALGRILARRGAYPEAARLLQDARKRSELRPELRVESQRHLIATLAAEAADDRLGWDPHRSNLAEDDRRVNRAKETDMCRWHISA
jgi:tetratricopeptide (TPR) repeat protein